MDKKSKVILAISFIFATSCKREEALNSTSNTNWKTSDWMLIKKNINVKGTLCNLYENIKTHQQIYEAVNNNISKALDYCHQFFPGCDGGVSKCYEQGNQCALTRIDGEDVIVLKNNSRKK